MAQQHGARASGLGLPLEPVEGSTALLRVIGTSAYLREGTKGLTAAAWAVTPGAARRIFDRIIEDDQLSERVEPPRQLLPDGADRQGSLGSVRAVLRAAGLTYGETASYRIMTDGAYCSTELGSGAAGIGYHYVDLNDDQASVAVIVIALTREDWQPDRRLIRFQQ